MRITRRDLTIAGALTLGGLGLWRSSAAVAQSADEAAVAQVVEALRKAIFGQEKPQLEALCAEQLSYGHSDGRVENKAQFINGVMTRKAILKSLTLSDHTIAIVGADAIARHTWRLKAKPTVSSPTPRLVSCRSGRSKTAPGNCWPVRVSGHRKRKRHDGLLRHRWRSSASGKGARRYWAEPLSSQGPHA